MYAKALSHPIRVNIIELLLQQSCCYSGDLSDTFGIAKSTLSQHLKVLKEAGLIQGELNPPKIKYCVNRKNWSEARELLEKLINLGLDKKYIINHCQSNREVKNDN